MRLTAKAGNGVVPRFVEIVPGLIFSPGIFRFPERSRTKGRFICPVGSRGEFYD
jgi:hypothetical protein